MWNYLARRLLLLPITLFCIVLVNFIIINLAPGDPVTVMEISPEGGASRQDQSVAFSSDERYLQFREFFGLTLPILFNRWPWVSKTEIKENLNTIIRFLENPDQQDLSVKEYHALRLKTGDMARFVMPNLLSIMQNSKNPINLREIASQFFIRGGTKMAFVGPNLTKEQKKTNRIIAKDNSYLRSQLPKSSDSEIEKQQKFDNLEKWYHNNAAFFHFEPTFWGKVQIFFTETRFFKYMSRVLTLDFGVLRNDRNKRVINEVTKRFKYSLTLSIIPMLLTFLLCMILGFVMALKQYRWPDLSTNVTCLILYAIPVFVVAPFLIEKVALGGHFPFTNIPYPLSGFTSPDAKYEKMTSYQRLFDVIRHIFLPIIAIIYGTLAAQSRLARTAILEVMRNDYVRTAKAKGLSPLQVSFKHIGRNAAITIVTALASSLGIILGGSLIVETLFEIDGFGKFFYDAILNRDYNVIMFSALAGAFLSLLGYLAADIAYTVLDPRVTLD